MRFYAYLFSYLVNFQFEMLRISKQLYVLSFREKKRAFPPILSRAALCCHLAFCLFSMAKRSINPSILIARRSVHSG